VFLGQAAVLLKNPKDKKQTSKIRRGNPRFDSIFYNNAPVFKRTSACPRLKKIISLHSDLVYTYKQQIFIDEIQVYSRRHIQLSSTHDNSGGQPSIFCFARFHWSERLSEHFCLFFAMHGQSVLYQEAY
jgi:hypothetical protein